MSWTIVHDGDQVTGTASLVDEGAGATGRGTLRGSYVESTLTFTVAVPAGSFTAPYQACSADVHGTGTVAGSTLTADYEGVSSCSGPITSGRVVLTRR